MIWNFDTGMFNVFFLIGTVHPTNRKKRWSQIGSNVLNLPTTSLGF